MKREIRDYLEDILDAIGEIEGFVSGLKDFNSFVNSKEKTYATVYLLAKIGEAVKKVPDSIKSRYPQVPWRDIAGMRDILMHEYFRTDLERVWGTVNQDLQPLKEAVKRILKETEK